MLNTLATEALSSASFVDNFIDSVDHVPDDIQRVITRIRNIDVEFRGLLCDVDHFYDLAQGLRTVDMNSESRKSKRRRFLTRMHQTLIRAQEIGDEKMHLVNQMQELIDAKTRQLEVNENLDVREDLQQMQMSQVDVSAVQMPKHLRAQSPLLAEELINRNYNNAADNVVRIMAKEGSFVPYNVLPNAVPSTSDVSALAGNNIMNNDVVRGNNKRSRRRNDTATEYDQFALNEAGNSVMGVLAMNERSTTSRALNVSNQKKLNANMSVNTPSSLAAVQSSNSSVVSSNSSTGKKKKRKTGGRHTSNQNQLQTNTREDTPPLEAIDPDEPTYCVCNQISFGEMILCDNDLCPIEWFHFSCVFLTLKPKGKWYCPNCRGDRPNVMKPKAQFLKELERYNKEKEEKP